MKREIQRIREVYDRLKQKERERIYKDKNEIYQYKLNHIITEKGIRKS